MRGWKGKERRVTGDWFREKDSAALVLVHHDAILGITLIGSSSKEAIFHPSPISTDLCKRKGLPVVPTMTITVGWKYSTR